MSRETIIKIKEAEEEAKRIIREAHLEAEARMEAERAEGERLCRETEEALTAELSGMMDQLRARLAKMEARVESETKHEAETLADLASLNRRAAEKIIVSGVNAKCR